MADNRLSGLNPEQQSFVDSRVEVRIKKVENGYIVKTGPWHVFATLPEAFDHITAHYAAMAEEESE